MGYSIKLDVSSTYHPQKNVVNCSIKDFLQSLVGDLLKSWNKKLVKAEFAYNCSMNWSIVCFSPFFVVYRTNSRAPLDLAPISYLKIGNSKA
jgi:hypothetical protein